MWKMAPRHWTAVPAVAAVLHRARGSFSRHCPREGRASFIEAIAISRCRRNRCLETAPSPARGEQPYFFNWCIYLSLRARYDAINQLIVKTIGLTWVTRRKRVSNVVSTFHPGEKFIISNFNHHRVEEDLLITVNTKCGKVRESKVAHMIYDDVPLIYLLRMWS